MADFGVTSDELRACGSRLRQIGDEVRERMRSLGKDVDALLTEWQGRAADGFACGWEEWLTGAMDVLRALDTLGGGLDVSGHRYADADATASGEVIRSGGELL